MLTNSDTPSGNILSFSFHKTVSRMENDILKWLLAYNPNCRAAITLNGDIVNVKAEDVNGNYGDWRKFSATLSKKYSGSVTTTWTPDVNPNVSASYTYKTGLLNSEPFLVAA